MKKRRCCVRFLSVFCVLSVIATILSGCTPEEIGFIDLINERNSASQYRIEGIYGESSDRYSEYNYDSVTDIRYIAEINRDADYMHITINGKISGVEFSEPFDYYVSGKKYYINKNIMRYNNAVLLSRNEQQLANSRRSNKHNDVSYLLDELDNTVLKNVDYIMVDLSGNNWEIIPMESYPSTNIFNVINGIPFDMDEEFMRGDENKKNVLKSADYEVWENYLNEAYSGFTTDMITEIPNGYKLEAGPERLEDTTINFAQYLYPHIEEIYNSWVYYMNMFLDSIPCSDDETRQIVEKLRNESIPEKDEFLSFAQKLQENNSYERKGSYRSSWDEYVSYSVTKENNTYQTVQRFIEVYNKAEKPVTKQIYHEKNQTAVEVTPEPPRDYIGGDEYDTIYEETRRQINPPTAMEICSTIWDINHPSPCVRDENGTPILSRLPMYPDYKLIYKNGDIKRINALYIYENNNGNLCIPINNVAKAFDEEVVWDENSQTEAIKRGDEIITFDGVWYSPVPELSFYIIPVREFEKLGYTVEYIETKKEDCKDIKINIIKH